MLIPNDPKIFLLFAATLLVACSTSKPVTSADTLPPTEGLGACKTKLVTGGVEGSVRYVEGNPRRALWDEDGDGSPEREERRTFDDQGRLVQIEQALPDGTVVERVARMWEANRLVAETGDVFDAKGLSVADGTPDWKRTLVWDATKLVEEKLDQRDADMLPGIDGTPEFRIVWDYAEGSTHPSGATRFEREMPVARQTNRWEGARLVERRIDFGPDGSDDLVEKLAYDKRGRVTRIETRGPVGEQIVEHTYCD